MSLGLGRTAKLEVGTALASITNELCLATDVTFERNTNAADSTGRCDTGDRTYIPGQRTRSFSFDCLKDTTTTPQATAYNLLESAFNAGTFVYVRHTTHGGDAERYKCMVENFSDSEPLDEVVTTSVTLRCSGGPQ